MSPTRPRNSLIWWQASPRVPPSRELLLSDLLLASVVVLATQVVLFRHGVLELVVARLLGLAVRFWIIRSESGLLVLSAPFATDRPDVALGARR